MTGYMCLSHLFRSLLLAAAASARQRFVSGTTGGGAKLYQHVTHRANVGSGERRAPAVANCVGITANIEQAPQSVR
jgi:hypothetical protein